MLVLGDFFNEVLNLQERKGNSNMSASMNDFQKWVSSMNILEFPLLSRKYTWYRNNLAGRIDRAFVDTEWLDRFNELKLWGFKRSVLNHNPIIVDCEKTN